MSEPTRRRFLKRSGTAALGATVLGRPGIDGGAEGNPPSEGPRTLTGPGRTQDFTSRRPPLGQRRFTSEAVEATIRGVKERIVDPELAWLFENCYPNTLDTTVDFGTLDGKPDTFVISGDIEAMWLRDSTAQVWPYLSLA